MSHALFPPSGAERWLKCAYSVKISTLFPSIDNAASLEGTRRHEICSLHLIADTDSKDKGEQTYINAVRKADGELFVEHKVVVVPGLCWGTLDAAKVYPTYLSLFDLKWGKSPVQATDNPQMLCYANGLLREIPLPRGTPVDLTIVQPNASSGWPVKHHRIDVDRVLEFKPKIMIAIDNAMKDNPVAIPGKHCYWCPAKMHCEAYLYEKGKKNSLLRGV